LRLRHPEGRVWTLRFSDDATMLASASQSVVRVWEPRGGQLLHQFGDLPDMVTVLSFSRDLRYLAIGTCAGLVRIWSLEDRSEVLSFNTSHRVVHSLAFSPDGALIASSGSDSSILIWNLSTKEVVTTVKAGSSEIRSLVFSGDSSMLAAGDDGGSIIMWKVPDFSEPRRISSGHGSIRKIALSSDSRRLAAADHERVTVWEAPSGKLVAKTQGKISAIDDLVFSRDAQAVVIGTKESGVWTWEIDSGKATRILRLTERARIALAVVEKDHPVAAAAIARGIEVWDLSNRIQIAPAQEGHPDAVVSIAFGPEEGILISAGEDGTAHLWELGCGRTVHRFKGASGTLTSIALSPDGSRLACGDSTQAISVWEVRSGNLIQTLKGHQDDVAALGFSTDGTSLVSGGFDANLIVWELQGKEPLRSRVNWQGHKFSCACNSPNGVFLGSGTTTGIVQIWNAANGKVIHSFSCSATPIRAIGFDSTSDRFLAASENGQAMVWEVSIGRQIASFQLQQGRLCSAAISPDGRMVAMGSSSGAVEIWEVASGQRITRSKEHIGAVTAIAFSPDGRSVATGSADTSLVVWNVAGLCSNYGDSSALPEPLDQTWNDLGSRDPSIAFRALWRMPLCEKLTIDIVGTRILPSERVREKVESYLAGLEDDDPNVRRRALEELRAVGAEAEPQLRDALLRNAGPELAERARELIDCIEAYPIASESTLRRVRAIQLLEVLGSQQSLNLLRAISRDAPSSLEKSEARRSILRLSARKESKK
jgi:WD40 repeat protein